MQARMSKLLLFVLLTVCVTCVLTDNTDKVDEEYQNWFVNVFGHKNSLRQNMLVKSIIRPRCQGGYVRIQNKCVKTFD